MYNENEETLKQGGAAMCCWSAKMKHSNKNCIWIVLLLFVLELAAVSGKIEMATYLPHDVERQATSAVIRKVGTVTPGAALSSVLRGVGTVARAEIGEQRVQQRAVSRTCISICGIFVLFLYRLARRLLYRLSNKKTYRRLNYTVSYMYNLSYL